MKTKITGSKKRDFKLVVDGPKKNSAVLGIATTFEDLNVWTVEDLRLSMHGLASPYFHVSAHEYWASWVAPDAEAAKNARSLLRESFPVRAEKELTVEWCTFDGIVRTACTEQMPPIGAATIQSLR